MRTINMTFEDKEFEKIVKEKNKVKSSWEKFLLSLIEEKKK
jgi:hypothetical protein